jgi:4-aminobutyrate aminotransferase-like enzyme
MVKAEGIYFWDGDGKRYIDLNAQLMCSNIGHGHPKVIKAIQDQVTQFFPLEKE